MSSYIEALKNNCRSKGHTNLSVIYDAYKLYTREYASFQKKHIAEPLGAAHHFWNICSDAAMTLSRACSPRDAAAALLAPIDRKIVKAFDPSLYKIISAYDKMKSFAIPTNPNDQIAENYYKMLVADPFLRNNFSGEDLLSAHFVMYGIMLKTLEKGTSAIQLFYKDPVILSQLAMSTAELLSRLNRNYEANRLKDAALNIIRPDQYKFFSNIGYGNANKVALLEKRDALLIDLRRFCEDMLNDQNGYSFEIEGRLKSVYSIKEKSKKYAKGKFDTFKPDILDILGFRIILHFPKGPSHIDSYDKQYEAANIEDKSLVTKSYFNNLNYLTNLRDLFRLHAKENKWELIEEDDYLFKPKENGYQSLQDIFMFPLEGGESASSESTSAEFQLVSDQMYECNSTGRASNREYKKGESLKKYYKTGDIKAMYKDIQNEFSNNVYAFAYKLSGNDMEISGPFEMLPKKGGNAKPLDVLSKISYLNAKLFKIFNPTSKTERIIKIDNNINNGDIVSGEGTTKFGAKRLRFLETPEAKSSAGYLVDSENLTQNMIAETKRQGKTFLNGLIESNGKNLGKGFKVDFLEDFFLEENNYSSMDVAHFYIDDNKDLHAKLKKEINKYLLAYKFDAKTGEATFIGHHESLFARALMKNLADNKHNIRSVYQYLDGENTVFKAKLDKFSEKDFEALSNYLGKTGCIRKLYDYVPQKSFKDNELVITFSSDEPGSIYKIYSFLTKNNCFISSLKSNEPTPGDKPTVYFTIKFPGNFDEKNRKNFLDNLIKLPDAFIKQAKIS